MTDRFFPDVAPEATELRLIMAVRYVAAPTITEGFFNVKVYATEIRSVVEEPISVPGHYHDHLTRFLWRHHVFMELQTRSPDLDLPDNLRPLLQRYIQYMDAIVEGLLTTVQKNVKAPAFRSHLFDMYLAVEYHVGHHRFRECDFWRVSHPQIILECQNVQDIGRLHAGDFSCHTTVLTICTDWTTYYAKRDQVDPVWSGRKYGFRVAKVPDAEWQTLVDRAAQYLGLSVRKRAFYFVIIGINTFISFVGDSYTGKPEKGVKGTQSDQIH